MSDVITAVNAVCFAMRRGQGSRGHTRRDDLLVGTTYDDRICYSAHVHEVIVLDAAILSLDLQ